MTPSLDLRTDDARKLPASLDAEQALLGSIIEDNEHFHALPDGFGQEVFHEDIHRRLFAEVARLIGNGVLAEPVRITEAFKEDPALKEMGGPVYIANLLTAAPTWNAGQVVASHAALLIDLHKRREMIRLADEIMAQARGGPAAADIIAHTENALLGMSTGRAEGGLSPFRDGIDGALESIAAAMSRDGDVSGLATGLIDLDRKLGGLHPSDLVILGGRPSMGKTSLATNIAFNVARRGKVVGFFSLEMSQEQLTHRILADAAGVSGDQMRKGEVDMTEFARIRDCASALGSLPIHIDATGGLPVAKLCARARRMKRLIGLDLIVIDYLQLVTGSIERGRGGNRTQEVTEITQAFKALAKELNVPVLALSQLSRQVETREDKRPMLADLRESGSIEQDADAVLFVYREAYYLGRAEPKPGSPEHMTWTEEMDRVQGLADVIVAKQRHGPIGTVKLHFDEDLTKFSNLAREERFAPPAGERRVVYSHGGDA